jgi:hypothetical protein
MDTIANNFDSTPAPAGIFYPQDFALQKLDFINASGQRFEMQKLMVEMSYYEDIYSFCASGSVTIRDSQGFIELFQLSGNEYMEINFGKVKDAANSDDQIFHVYKIGKRLPTGNLNDEFYTLYFCSEELYLSEQLKISKSYLGQKISSIVKSILTDILKTKSSKINKIEETIGVYDFLVPRFKPLETISWISTYARPDTGGKGSDMLFYENRYGYNFRSLQSIYKDPVYASYRYQQKNLSKDLEKIQDKVTSVLDYEFVKTYDVLNDTNSGTFANQLISLDPITRKSSVTNFDYTKYQKESASLNGNKVLNSSPNRLGTTPNQNYSAVTKVAIGNSNQAQSPYIKQAPGSVAKDIYLETYIPNRSAQLGLANYTVLKIMIPGDPGVTAGSIINFELLSLKPSSTTKEADRFYSGKYLVSAVRHVINDSGSYITILEIAKDSNNTAYGNTNNNASERIQAVQE